LLQVVARVVQVILPSVLVAAAVVEAAGFVQQILLLVVAGL
jgi:hypothetical protein